MQQIFKETDIIYILVSPSRKKFVMDQISKNNISSKVKIINAYTPEHHIVKDAICKHHIYSVLTDTPSAIACILGVRDIMIDIVKNKYKYAMVLEDDVVFPEEHYDIANKWITKENISKYFNIDLPYILYLQSSVTESKIRGSQNREGIIYTNIKYGQPAYIINDKACELFLRYMYPITSPIDDYTHTIKKLLKIKQAILVPYICRELSANHHGFDLNRIDFNFKRLIRKSVSILKIMSRTIFWINQTADQYNIDNLTLHLLKKLNSGLNYKLCSDITPIDTMKYSIGELKTELCDEYIISGTITHDTKYINNKVFFISVRGKISQNILRQRFGIQLNKVYDIFIYYSYFFPKDINPIYECCFIYDYNINFDNKEFIFVNSNVETAESIIDKIVSSKCIISDNCRFITIANSYNIPGLYATLDKPVSYQNSMIAADHYSNISKDKINPLEINISDDNIKSVIEKYKISFPQLDYTIYKNELDVVYNLLPFNLCKKKINKDNLRVQIAR